ncbi:MAG: AAA family ATPase [Mycobacterium leprae]
MRIDQLMLTGFGRFQGRRLDLAPGLNILAGPNEAGKTTIQKFILGMLYGFKKRSLRRDYTDDADRYRPWQGGDYRGSLIYTLDNGRRYRVEREFEPARELVRLFDDLTGADLSDRFTLDRRKELLFAEEHLRLPEEIFRSTAWVGQLQVGELEMGRELLTRLANMQESGRDDLSVKDALAYLEEQMREIGSERAPTRPYARVSRLIETRSQELEQTTAAREQIREWEVRLNECRTALRHADEEQAFVQHCLDWQLLQEASERLERTRSSRQRLAELRGQIGRLAAYADFPVQMRDQLLQVESARAMAVQRAAELGQSEMALLEAEAVRLNGMIAEVDSLCQPLQGVAEQGEVVLARAEELDGQIARLRVTLDQQNNAVLRERVNELRRHSAQNGALLWVWIALMAVAMGGGAYLFVSQTLGMPFVLGAGGVALVALVLALGALIRGRRTAGAMAQTRADLERAYQVEEQTRHQVMDLEEEKRRLLGQVGAASVSDVHRSLTRYQQLNALRERHQIRQEQIQAQVAVVKTEMARARELGEQVAAGLQDAGVESIEQFETACSLSEAWAKAKSEAQTLQELLRSLLGGEDVEDLAMQVEQLRARVQGDAPADTRSVPELQKALQELQTRRSELSTVSADLAARVETGLAELPEIADLQAEIDSLRTERATMDAELAALELAKNTMIEAREEIHRDFAPMLNNAMGRAVAELTNGRYESVKVDDSLGIRALADGDRTVDLVSLSGGTIDQFYLALRLALLEMIQGAESIPLMLDDPFVQYDDTRVERAMAHLAAISLEHQVIFMTCHQREIEIARALGLEANVVPLIGE